jgi:hypothetical protein
LRPLDFDDSNKRKTGMASSHFQPRSRMPRRPFPTRRSGARQLMSEIERRMRGLKR